jgi:hypothetical protein
LRAPRESDRGVPVARRRRGAMRVKLVTQVDIADEIAWVGKQ